MWSARSEMADMYLSGRTVAVGPTDEVFPCALGEDWVPAVQAALAEWPRRRWRVWLGGRRCGLHLCEPIAGVRGIEEAESALSASLSLDSRPVSVRLATWSVAPRLWLALATEAGLIERLMSSIEEGDGRVHSLRPWWTMLPDADATSVAMCDDEAITYWRVDERGGFTAAATLWTAEGDQAASLKRLRVGGPLKAWRLELDGVAGNAQAMAVSPLDEGAHAAS